MPRRDGTEPFSHGPGTGCGMGRDHRGRMGGSGLGPGGNCVCSFCAASLPHRRGIPCYNMVCSKCGPKMARK